MADVFHLKIISPARVVVDTHVASAEISGTEGDFGVLPGHAPFFSMLRPGVLNVTFSDGSHQRFFAASGYAEVAPGSCTIISDHIQDLADVSAAEAQEALTAARNALANAQDAPTRAQATTLVESAERLVAAVDAH